MSDDHLTDYGFTFGPAEVIRIASINGTRVLAIKAGRHTVDVYVSKTGRSVRVWRDGKELHE
jgi:hypothetical protein